MPAVLCSGKPPWTVAAVLVVLAPGGMKDHCNIENALRSGDATQGRVLRDPVHPLRADRLKSLPDRRKDQESASPAFLLRDGPPTRISAATLPHGDADRTESDENVTPVTPRSVDGDIAFRNAGSRWEFNVDSMPRSKEAR